jgi:hypothetical protein
MNGEKKQIQDVIDLYSEGCYYGDAEKLIKAFSEDAVMQGFMTGRHSKMTAEAFIAGISGAPSMASQNAAYKSTVEGIEYWGNIAVASIREEGFFGQSFLNHFQLIKTELGWKIVSKLFTTTAE